MGFSGDLAHATLTACRYWCVEVSGIVFWPTKTAKKPLCKQGLGKKGLAMVVLLGLAWHAFGSFAFADTIAQPVGDAVDEPQATLPTLLQASVSVPWVMVRNRIPIHSRFAERETPWAGEVTEPINWHDQQLPAGAWVGGHVVKARASRIGGSAGYVVLAFDHVQLPNGDSRSLCAANTSLALLTDEGASVVPPTLTLVHPKVEAAKRNRVGTVTSSVLIPSGAVALIVLAGVGMPYMLGVGVVGGAVAQTILGDKTLSPWTRMRQGAINGTGVPVLYKALKRPPNALVEFDDPIALPADALFAHCPETPATETTRP